MLSLHECLQKSTFSVNASATLHPKRNINIPYEITRDTHSQSTGTMHQKINALLCIHVCLPHPVSVSIFFFSMPVQAYEHFLKVHSTELIETWKNLCILHDSQLKI
jgi:hypothetical protein